MPAETTASPIRKFAPLRHFRPVPAEHVHDPITEGLFIRTDGEGKPGRVSRSVWATVFPYDRDEVKRIAGTLFIGGMSADEAVLAANRQVEISGHLRTTPAETLHALAGLFPPSTQDRQGPPPLAMLRAASAIGWTAMQSWQEILSGEDPIRDAFIHRRWHSSKDVCLVCLEEATAGIAGDIFQGDYIHDRCRPAMARIGPVWGNLVVMLSRQYSRQAIRQRLIDTEIPQHETAEDI